MKETILTRTIKSQLHDHLRWHKNNVKQMAAQSEENQSDTKRITITNKQTEFTNQRLKKCTFDYTQTKYLIIY